jgi:hypothetical protein
MHIHYFTFNEPADTIYAVGQGKLMAFETKG